MLLHLAVRFARDSTCANIPRSWLRNFLRTPPSVLPNFDGMGPYTDPARPTISPHFSLSGQLAIYVRVSSPILIPGKNSLGATDLEFTIMAAPRNYEDRD